ncbi:hypothetical protein EV644_11452 [Kribbella orskensis]|uniref:Alpha/beta hydrolase family protein n=1 Tax=Kribbella orskensis TaxID=2512216 RepID=A0ABY2BDP6_9ACTN|nr:MULTISPECIES: hypothetical protein [Kribbella]TCN35797.1 hypothetical protein EV642_11552 [Kribbella sp. VKM Ac-2500]TCO17404.1 hypothetical protein EV644_11452 [Kribbella orskensis]
MPRRVRSADGTEIALYEYGDRAAPVLVCVHGYPDNATLWKVLAHDWGSIQAWQIVTSERLRGRIASFVSISGPTRAAAHRRTGAGGVAGRRCVRDHSAADRCGAVGREPQRAGDQGRALVAPE